MTVNPGSANTGLVRKLGASHNLVLNDIDYTKTKSPQTDGICKRFYKTILDEFYRVVVRKKLYADLETLQQHLDDWLVYDNDHRPHQGKMCCGVRRWAR